jgi:uncharacterized protein YlxP (DUF503 family)
VTIGVYTFEIHLPAARSLKDKRQVVRRLKDRLRAHHNLAVTELSEHSDVWQRGGLAVVSVASRREPLEQLFAAVLREAEREVPGSVIETGTDFIEGSDGGAAGWEGDYR